jgi:hypothetical protein
MNKTKLEAVKGMIIIRDFRTSESESESADFSEVRVRKFRTLKTLRTRTQRVCTVVWHGDVGFFKNFNFLVDMGFFNI